MIDEEEYWQEPAAVLLPASTEEVSAILRYATEHKISVTPRGGGSGLAGGAIAAKEGIVLSVEKMRRIIEVDTVNSVVIAEAGVITGDLDKHLYTYGLFFPAYPMSNSISCIGGNVACNAGGSRAIKYGVTGTHVLGAECVLADGRVIELGGRYIKRVCGYNLLSLLIGSEGTLAIFTRLTLRIMPRPPVLAAGIFLFSGFHAAIQCIARIRNQAAPSALEYMDRNSVCIADPNYETKLAEGELLLLVEVDAQTRQSADEQWEAVRTICNRAGGRLQVYASSKEEHDDLWKLRHTIPWALKRYCGSFHNVEDTVVPLASLAEYTQYIYTLAEQFGIPMAVFGHAGDGNVHIIPLKTAGSRDKTWSRTLRNIQQLLYAKVYELGGCISGEHGIGQKRRLFLGRFSSQEEMTFFRAVKKMFDPARILNPGKIL